MVSKKVFNQLVERVVKRIIEEDNNIAFSKTEMPKTEHPPTMPASASKEMQNFKKDMQGKSNKGPNAMPPSQTQMKLNAIRKELDSSGYTSNAENAKKATQALPDWYDSLDPGDALVATAKELADRFSSE